MSDTQIPSDAMLTVTLSAALWQRVMTQLAEGALKDIGMAYGEIDRQLQGEVRKLAPQQRANGEARPNA